MTSKILTTVISLGLILYFVSGVTVMARNTIEVPFNFSEGWNMIAGFYKPDQLSGGAVEPENILAVYALVPETQQYARLYPNPEKDKLNAQTTRVDTMVTTSAFWVYSDKAGKTEYMTLEPAPVGERRLTAGWNFVGLTIDLVDLKYKNMKGDCQVIRVCAFERGRWDCSPESTSYPESDEVVLVDDESSVGLGLLLKVKSDCKFGGSSGGTTSPPPSIPN